MEGVCETRKGRCVVFVIVGFIFALLLLFIILHISITAERDQLKNTISSLQHDNTDQKTDKQQLEDKYNSLTLEKRQLETRVNDLSAQKNQLQNKVNSLNQKILELENRVTIQGWFFTEEMSWCDSRQYCWDRGADLIIIKSEEKQRVISSLEKEDVWIGLSNKGTIGTMKWVDNSPLNQGFWAVGEPTSYPWSLDEVCVEVRISQGFLYNWNDLRCSNRRRGICEK